MRSYHGTSSVSAVAIAHGAVNVTRGGGELGRGFYSGEHLHEAKAWAFHQSGDKRRNVIEFETPDTDVENLSIKLLDHGTAILTRHRLRNTATTRVHLFNYDMVWAPIVGSERASGDQYKWESQAAQTLLNGSMTARTVL